MYSAARNRINSVPQTAATTFSLLFCINTSTRTGQWTVSQAFAYMYCKVYLSTFSNALALTVAGSLLCGDSDYFCDSVYI